jgi:AcrR family transcriptional regulator
MIDNQTTENKILDAAKAIFIEKGLESAKMVDIAEKAGISRTSLNYYYRTKENLFYAIIEGVFEMMIPKIENLSLLRGDAVDKIGNVVDIYDDMLRKNEFVPRFLFVEVQRNPKLIHDFVAQSAKAQIYLSALDALLNKEVGADNIPYTSKSHLIMTFFGLIFVPYLLEPLLAMYRDNEDKGRDAFLDTHKEIVKKLIKTYFEKILNVSDL